MVKKPDIDLKRLDERARSSDDGEGYTVVARGDWFKIGLVSRIEETSCISYSIELLIRVLEENREVYPSQIKQVLDITDILTGRGYYLTSEDGGWIYAERRITSDRIKDEMGLLISLFNI